MGDDFDELGESRTKDDAVVLSCCETDFYRGRRKEKPVSSIKFIIYQNLISFAKHKCALQGAGMLSACLSSN